MVYRSSGNSALGLPGIGATGDTEMKVPVGTRTTMYDDVQGEGSFIYLPGAAGVVAGDAVAFDLVPGAQSVTRLVSAGFATSGRPVAIATTAIGAGQWGWYQVGGIALVNAIAATAAGPLFATATPGSIGSAILAGSQISGARISSPVGTPVVGKSYVMLANPVLQTQIT